MKQLQIEKVLTYVECLRLHTAIYNEEKRLLKQMKNLHKKGLPNKHISPLVNELQMVMFKLNIGKCKTNNW